MSVEKSYAGVAGAMLDDVWIYGLDDVVNPRIEINGASLEDASKIDFNERVSIHWLNIYLRFISINFSFSSFFVLFCLFLSTHVNSL